MRTFIAFFILFLSSFVITPYYWYLKALSKKDPDAAWEKAYRLVRGFFFLELKLMKAKVTVRGHENIPEDTACLFVGNHRSYFDILITHNTIGRPVGYIAKSEMKKAPLIRLYMKAIGCLFLDRDNIRQGLETINQGAELLKQGHSMVLFPEGHRSHEDTFLPFKEGGYKMADKSGCPIIPFAVSRTDILLERAPKGLRKWQEVFIEFGEPIYPNDYPIKERKAKYKEIPDIIAGMRKTHKI